jgi:glutamate dehydrogenase
MQRLERDGYLDRELEFLPSSEEVAARLDRGEGLTAPELSVLMAYTKIALAEQLIDTGLPDDPFLVIDLFEYFPTVMRERYADQIEAHPLRREIVVTQVVNALVNGAGITFYHRLSQETGAGPEELMRANFVAREIFGSRAFVDSVYSYDNQIDAAVQIQMRIEMRTLVERVTRWLINNRRSSMDSSETIEFFRGPIAELMGTMPELLVGRELEAYERRREQRLQADVPEELAERVAVLPPAYSLLTIVETAKRDGVEPAEVARVHFALGDRLGLSTLVQRILALPRDDRWQTMARAALRDDLHAVHSALTAQVLARTSEELSVEERISAWEKDDEVAVQRAVATLTEICGDDKAELAQLSVGLRVVRTLLATQ